MPLSFSTLQAANPRLQQRASVQITAQRETEQPVKTVDPVTTVDREPVTRETITSDRITGLSIPLLLEWWQQRKRLANSRSNLHATLPKGDDLHLRAYYRLMEVYSVVKSGGVQAQTEAVQAFAERESRLLHQRLAEINADKTLTQPEKQQAREHIEQELTELKCANDWRLQALVKIAPEEEALVQQYLPAIENTLMMQSHCA